MAVKFVVMKKLFQYLDMWKKRPVWKNQQTLMVMACTA